VGNIKAMTWYSSKPSGLGGSSSPNTYVYNYDPKYQLIAGTWGTPGFGTIPAGFTPSTANQEKVIIPGSGTPGTPAYDANGNITNMQRTDGLSANTDVLAYTYTANTNRIATIANTGAPAGTYTYGYDQIGRETSEDVGDPIANKTIQYDCRGDVTLVSNTGGPVVAYVYDEAGMRIQKIDYNTTTHAVALITSYFGDVIYTQTAIGGTLTPQEYAINGTTGRIGIYVKQSNFYYYQLTDHLGNVRAVLDQSGLPQTTYDYYPFGSIYARYAYVPYRYGYQGQSSEMDGETNWNSFQSRMYNPRIGRWTITDPDGQFYSPYIGMGNNPILLNDPNGAFIPPTTPGNYSNGNVWSDEDGLWYFQDNQWIGVEETAGINFHIDAQDLTPITVIGSHGLLYNVWNSPAVRSITPDFINVGGGFAGIFGTGAAPSMEFNWVLHGPQASWKPIFTTTVAVGGGYSVDATFNVGTVSFTGDASKITRSMVITNSMRGDVPTVWASGGLSEILKLGGTLQYTKLPEGSLVGSQLNFGLGLPAGPVPINAAAGVSNTYLLYDFGGVLKRE
jgi:RHS repeat-associated protein